jgi:16S rRNA G527 N7-methylase RsmG
MNTSNTQAQTEQTQTNPTIDVLSYRLCYKDNDITNDHDFINTFDTMTTRAIALLEVMAGYMAKTSQSKDDFIDADAMYYTLQTAINEIKDVKAVTNAYVDSKHKA